MESWFFNAPVHCLFFCNGMILFQEDFVCVISWYGINRHNTGISDPARIPAPATGPAAFARSPRSSLKMTAVVQSCSKALVGWWWLGNVMRCYHKMWGLTSKHMLIQVINDDWFLITSGYTIRYIGDCHTPSWEILLTNQCKGMAWSFDHCSNGQDSRDLL